MILSLNKQVNLSSNQLLPLPLNVIYHLQQCLGNIELKLVFKLWTV